jgi:hypothetical protein
MTKQKKGIAIADVPEAYVRQVLRFVDDQYDFELTTDRDAHYVFHGVGGLDVLNYPGVRIFITGENVTPNFAISDYAMAFEKMTFGDRYCWMPNLKMWDRYTPFRTPRPSADEVFAQKTDFCAYVMSNTTDSDDARTRIFDLLSEYKQVNSGGKWRNNVGGRVPDKQAFQEKHKFVIAFENCSHPGYLTEKFADAAAANAVPIYWGDPSIGTLFNPKAFVNCHDFQTLEEAVERVKEIDQDDTLYKQMLSEPWFPEGVEPDCLKDKTFADFLSNIFDQEPELAFRRNRGRWGIKTEKNLYDMHFRPHVQAYKRFRHNWRKVYHSLIPKRKKY